ncbi:hypothetical protein T439DRAFT_321118 [Meredithblackwellia eburnea MCA 4105]
MVHPIQVEEETLQTESIILGLQLQHAPPPLGSPPSSERLGGERSTEPTEREPLLGLGTREGIGLDRTELKRQKKKKEQWWRRPHPLWLMPIGFLTGLVAGAQAGIDVEIVTQLACRAVGTTKLPQTPVTKSNLPPITNPFTTVSFLGLPRIEANDQEWAAECRRSPAVSKRTTQYLTVVAMVSGFLAAGAAGVWGALSDRVGRTPVLAIGMFSMTTGTIGTILVATYPDKFGTVTYVSSYALMGLLGGPLSTDAVVSAYISDATEAGSRASIFSTVEGLKAAGIAIGPVLGSALLRLSSGFVLLPHYIDVFAFRLPYILLLLFVVPESLSRARRREGAACRAAESEHHQRLRSQESSSTRCASVPARLWKKAIGKIVEIFTPLAVLLPKEVNWEMDADVDSRPKLARTDLKPGQRDWNLTSVGLSYASLMVVPGISAVKLLFGRYVFNWGIDQVNEFITFQAVTKLLFLLVIFPLGIKRLQGSPPSPAGSVPVTSEEEWAQEAKRLKLIHDSRFDLNVIRWSIVLALVAYLICGVPSSSQTYFILGTALVNCSGAALPALQSLALTLSAPRDAGRLLASLSVLSSLAVEVVGPPFFGAVYVWSVDWFPHLMFFAAGAWFACALLPGMAIRLPGSTSGLRGDAIRT